MPASERSPGGVRASIAYFVSAHGFGHAARASAVMAAIHRRAPETHFHIFTRAPEWFFQDALEGPHTCHLMDTDVGLVQRSPLEEDLPATLARLNARFPIRRQTLTTCCRQVAALGCRLVICDIAAVGIAAAAVLGLPSILVENFTWDWIYTRYPGAPPGMKQHARYQGDVYAQARYRIQAEPVCHPLPVDLTTAPVCRSATVSPTETRRRLDVHRDTPMVMVTMGGTPAAYAFLNRLRREDGICFILPGMAAEMRREGNLILLPARSTFRHPDLIKAADAVVGKVGYSTIAEIYHAGTPFGFVQRPDFPESPPLADYIRSQMPSLELAPENFESGRWVTALETLLALPHRPPARPNGAEEIADFVLARSEVQGSPPQKPAEPL